MSLILCVETATPVCSVVLAQNGKVLAVAENNEGNMHTAAITLLVSDVLQKAGKTLHDLDAVAVSKGPGSYTGLRVGVSAAKGFCYALERPLIAIPTLASLTLNLIGKKSNDGATLFVPMIDARRMEVFCAVYNKDLKQVSETEALIVEEGAFSELLENNKVTFFGTGAAKCKEVIISPNAFFYDDIACTASSMAALADERFRNAQFEDLAYFEPFYLKDFVGTKPKS